MFNTKLLSVKAVTPSINVFGNCPKNFAWGQKDRCTDIAGVKIFGGVISYITYIMTSSMLQQEETTIRLPKALQG